MYILEKKVEPTEQETTQTLKYHLLSTGVTWDKILLLVILIFVCLI